MAKNKAKEKRGGAKPDRLEQIKPLVIIAMFSDDELMERLVLKGGNAIDLIHQIGQRASVDIDFSMESEFSPSELAQVRVRVEKALAHTFRAEGLEVFDVRMEEKPKGLTPDIAHFWGGYEINFKLIQAQKYVQYSSSIADLRRHALQLGEGSKFLVDISKHEYTSGKKPLDLQGYRIFVYTPEMIVCEKLRAICQQMPEYGAVVKRNRPGSARARDFFDIYMLVVGLNVDVTSTENKELLRNVFAAKRVPLRLLGAIGNTREFHRINFPAVKAAVKPGITVEEFDFYFDFILERVEQLKSLWNV